jgi:hypothetical protein
VVVGKIIVPAGVLPAGCFLTVGQGENPEVKKAETTCECEGEDVQTDAPVQVSSVIVELSLTGHCPGLDKENPRFDQPIRLELLGLKKSYEGQPYCFGFWKEGSGNKKDNQWSCLSDEVEVLGEEQGIVEGKGERTNTNLLTYRVRTSHFTSFAVLLFGTVNVDEVCGSTSDILWILSVSFIGAAITLFLCVSTLYVYNYRFRAFVGGHVGHSINNTTKLVRRVTMTSLQRGGSTSGIGVSLLQLGPSISPITSRID